MHSYKCWSNKKISNISILQSQVKITPLKPSDKSIIKTIKEACSKHLSFYCSVTEEDNSIVLSWYQVSHDIKNFQIKQLNVVKEKQMICLRSIRQVYTKKAGAITDRNTRFHVQGMIDEIMKETQTKLSEMYQNKCKNL